MKKIDRMVIPLAQVPSIKRKRPDCLKEHVKHQEFEEFKASMKDPNWDCQIEDHPNTCRCETCRFWGA